MKTTKNNFRIFLSLFVGLGLFFSYPIVSLFNGDEDILNRFDKELNAKEQLVSLKLAEFIKNDSNALFYRQPEQFLKLNNNQGISFYVFNNGQLIEWTNSSAPFHGIEDFATENGIVQLKNGWYQYLKRENGNSVYLGLIQIENEYVINNSYLIPGLHPSFGINSPVEISLQKTGSSVIVKSAKGNNLFYLTINSSSYQSSNWLYILTFFAGFVLLIISTYNFCKQHKTLKKNTLWISVVFVTLFYSICIGLSIPQELFRQKIFSPIVFGHSNFLPSLGHFLFTVITILSLTIIWVKQAKEIKKMVMLKSIVSMVVISILNVFFINWFEGLINNSNINFDVNNLLDLSAYSFVGIAIVMVLFTCLAVLIKLVLNDSNLKSIPQNQLLQLFWIIALVVILIAHLAFDINWKICSWILVAIIMFSFDKPQKSIFTQSILLLGLIAVVVSAGFIIFAKDKEQLNQEFLIKKLAKEADPITEYLFSDLVTKIKVDTTVGNHVNEYWENKDELDNYILSKYFTGYWNKYDIFLFLCQPQDTLVVQPENVDVSCFDFFTDKAEKDAVASTNFNEKIQFLYNKDGVGSYLGNITIHSEKTLGSNAKLYLEMVPKLLSNNEGYPELLLNEKEVDVSTSLAKYSFATYKKLKLTNSFGEYSYNLELAQPFHFNENGFFKSTRNGFEHVFYQSDKNTIVVLSSAQKTFFNYLTTFSYFFICCSLFILLVGYLFKLEPFNWRFAVTDFSTKIQLFIVVSTFLSFIMFALGTSYYIEKQYVDKNTKTLEEKVQSVVAELSVIFGEEESFKELDFVTNQLIKFSNVFYADINLFSTHGLLIATSRPEIFERGLISNRMNPLAKESLNNKKNSSFIHEEHVGGMKYLSAYIPFRNNNNTVIAYLNLPYFAKQNQLEKELSQFFTALINIYALLFLVSVIIAVFFANYISKPVRLIKDKISALQLGKSNELIDWQSNDEIGALVNEYNQKVIELEKSAILLAKSERESAWREMAKQVAHEIKNPLTPMKLSIQHLERSIENNPADLNERVKRTTKTLVEQIDTLTNIANEFSSFAKMPKTIEQQVNLIEIIENIVDLYKEEQVDISFVNQFKQEVFLYADKDQLNRLFSNLIKNAIQSIDEHKRGSVIITVKNISKSCQITIQDNGSGIPDELKNKIFTPNFTTKTTGMGLGLAMVKNIVENLNGTIGYTTNLDGTIFIIELPL